MHINDEPPETVTLTASWIECLAVCLLLRDIVQFNQEQVGKSMSVPLNLFYIRLREILISSNPSLKDNFPLPLLPTNFPTNEN